jgi:SAM-dependent methyltransferase
MTKRFYPHSIYNFLRIAESNSSKKRILDCGAGGLDPKIAIFADYGYELYGIDIDTDQIKDAKKFAKNNDIILNIIKGDMREIPFENDFFGLVFSYLSLVHLSKNDINRAIDEMFRVLQKGGLSYINFLSKDDKWFDPDNENSGEVISEHDGIQELHSYFEDSEPNKYFENHKILYSAKIQIFEGKYHNTGRTCILDYIVQKK